MVVLWTLILVKIFNIFERDLEGPEGRQNNYWYWDKDWSKYGDNAWGSTYCSSTLKHIKRLPR